MSEFGEQRERLADAMERRGAWPSRSPWIRQAVDALPRHAFAPERLWRWDGHAYRPVDKAADPGCWADVVYAGPDQAAVTQVTDGLPSSSLSAEAVVVDMLDSLRLEPGQKVLELGTGTGWNAALLARRAGPGRVTSIEVDPALAGQARVRLRDAGADVRVEAGDGVKGRPAGARYDRVIATYAVDHVPWAWVAQTQPGGRIVTPWGRLGHVALTVAPDGLSASGWMQGLGQFMPDRGTASGPGRGFPQVRGDGPADDQRPFERDLTLLTGSVHLMFALRVAVPDIRISTAADADGTSAWLHDGDSSWASLSALDTGRTLAYQGGPRRLADELDHAWAQWTAEDEPTVYDYGMTVTATEQYVWANDQATGPRWPATTPARPLPLAG